eukprot:2038520-Rhodomonas_salina.1
MLMHDVSDNLVLTRRGAEQERQALTGMLETEKQKYEQKLSMVEKAHAKLQDILNKKELQLAKLTGLLPPTGLSVIRECGPDSALHTDLLDEQEEGKVSARGCAEESQRASTKMKEEMQNMSARHEAAWQ